MLVAASDHDDLSAAKIALFRLELPAGVLRPLGKVDAGAGEAYGICLHLVGGAPHAFAVLMDGTINQVALECAAVRGGGGRRTLALRRSAQRRDRADQGRRYRRTPAGRRCRGRGPRAPKRARRLRDRFQPGDNAYTAYRLDDDRYVGRFRIVAGRVGAAEETDGIDPVSGDFGPAFPGGLPVVQDGVNDLGSQIFKLVARDDVARALRLEP